MAKIIPYKPTFGTDYTPLQEKKVEAASSKSRVEVDVRCRRERFLSTIYGGKGIESAIEPLELAFGTAVHTPITSMWMSPQEAGEEARNMMLAYMRRNMIHPSSPTFLEWPILAEALVFGYLHHVWPFVQEQYEVVQGEFAANFVDPLTGVKWRTRPDFILRKRSDSTYWYLELKTSGLDPSTFSKVWDRKAQLHLGALAMKQTHDLEIEGIIVQGFWKGTKYKGSLRSRLVGGYRRDAPPGLGKSVYRTEWAKGFEWFLASEYLGGVQAWVARLPREIIAEAFPSTPPIAPSASLVAEFLESYGHRELEIASAREALERAENHNQLDHIINTIFPKNVEACENPLTHARCQFYENCWNSAVGRDPVGSGLYRARLYKDGTWMEN